MNYRMLPEGIEPIIIRLKAGHPDHWTTEAALRERGESGKWKAENRNEEAEGRLGEDEAETGMVGGSIECVCQPGLGQPGLVECPR